MRNRKYQPNILLLIFCLIVSFYYFGQEKWNSQLDNPREFIENKGQFDAEKKVLKTILFAANIGGTQIYFTSNGLTYRMDGVDTEQNEREEHSTKKSEEERERELRERKTKSYFIRMNWVNANPNAEIRTESEVSNYYTYNNPTDKTGCSGIIAKAYQKIIYKNLYPHIDVEYFFPDGKNGLKYNIILHPGSDPNDIKINYSKSAKCMLDENGNLNISIKDKRIIEHAPVSYYEDFTTIKSAFVLKNNMLYFKFEKYDDSKKVIVDPWIINPNYNSPNKAFDVDYDYSGNVYVMGSDGDFIHAVKKFSNTGALLWTYNFIGLYGDFAIDRVTENVYIATTDLSLVTSIIKLNNSGIQVQSVVANMKEILRVVYNHCTNQLICGGGNMAYGSGSNIATFDSNLGNASVYNVETDLTDVSAMTLSKDGSAIFYLSTYSPFPILLNLLHKISTSDFSNLDYLINSGYNLFEMESNSYYGSMKWPGYNGITASNEFIYTYDGYLLRKWDQQNGALISSLQIIPTVLNGLGFFTKTQWGGIDVDECENIYVGFANSIRKYDSNLSLITTISQPDTVYDVRLSDQNTIYACGKSFVSENSLTPPPTVSMNHTDQIECGMCDGTATVVGICPEGIDNFSFSWNTVPVQTNDTAVNLCPGTYTVTVTKNSCNPIVYYTGSVTIDGSTGPAILTSMASTTASCTANDGTATVTASGGTPPFSYSWNTNPVQTSSTAIGLPSGMVVVTVSDTEGCSKSDSIFVPSQNTLDLTTSSLPISCLTNEGQAIVSVSGGIPDYSYSWSNGDVNASATVTNAGTYFVTVTDGAGCTLSDSVFVAPPDIPSSTAGSNSPVCSGLTINLTATNSSIMGSTYSWGGPNGFISSLQNPVITPCSPSDSGTYTLTVTSNDCSSVSTVFVVVKTPPIVNFNADTLKGCMPVEIVFTNSSTPSGDSVTWNFGDGTTISSTSGSTSHIFTNSGDYDISLTSFENGCSDTKTQLQMIHVYDNAIAEFSSSPTEVTIFDPIVYFTNLSSNASAYLWNFGDNSSSTLANPTHIYASEPRSFDVQLIANNIDNCPDTTVKTIVIIEPLLFYVPNTFTPDGNSFNEIFSPVMTSGFDKASYSIKIYNRWGEIIFETRDLAAGWDGKYRGEMVPDGTYTWEIVFKDKLTDKMYKYNGHLNVLR